MLTSIRGPVDINTNIQRVLFIKTSTIHFLFHPGVTAHHQNMAKQTPTLFEVPIGDSGKVTVNEVNEKVYLVTFSSPPDNRLTTVGLYIYIPRN